MPGRGALLAGMGVSRTKPTSPAKTRPAGGLVGHQPPRSNLKENPYPFLTMALIYPFEPKPLSSVLPQSSQLYKSLTTVSLSLAGRSNPPYEDPLTKLKLETLEMAVASSNTPPP
ncbi:hypothetical protein TIFTF001_001067 [Ficus carica]|uniref:Uncharacterized protein n=1 Tax=Ficus carica TaxID=3494 RepID=A0AA87ZGA9_FICCA|nr:hypothetical protein TIFTF001_001067 [Ficus carica]